MKTLPLKALTTVVSQSNAVLTTNIPLLSFFGSSVIATKFQSFILPELLSQAAWTIFLQSSLILSIWSNFSQSKIPNFKSIFADNIANKDSSEATCTIQTTSFSKSTNIKMLLSFILGCIGSYIGAFIGYTLSILYLKHQYLSIVNIPFESVLQLKMIASCLTASYIGGTANFFETKQVLSNEVVSSSSLINSGIDGSRVSILKSQTAQSLTTVAGIDILTMIAYFSILTFIRRNSLSPNGIQKHQEKFNGANVTKNKSVGDIDPLYSEGTYEKGLSSYSVNKFNSATLSTNTKSLLYYMLQYLVPLITSITICQLSTVLQSYSPIPGVSVICSLIISLSFAQGVLTVIERMRKNNNSDISFAASGSDSDYNVINNPILEGSRSTVAQERSICSMSKPESFIARVKRNCQVLSEIMLVLFYILIGLTSKLTDLLKAGAPTLILIVTSLMTHLLFMLSSARLWNSAANRYIQRTSKTGNSDISSRLLIDTDTIVIASNACIGGSSTAASMASTFGRSDLIFSATVVGIFGYVIGTPIGLFAAKQLHLEPQFILKFLTSVSK